MLQSPKTHAERAAEAAKEARAVKDRLTTAAGDEKDELLHEYWRLVELSRSYTRKALGERPQARTL